MKTVPAIVALFIAFCMCGASADASTANKMNGLDKAWAYLTLYENDENAVIQKIALVGRAQLDSVWVDPEDGEKYNDALWRRFRFGFKADVYAEWTAHLEADLDLNEPVSDWYEKLTDAYVAWSPTDTLKIKFLKQSAGFTLDGATSSKHLLTLERNNLTNNLWFTEEYFNGILAGVSDARGLSGKAGFFSSDGAPELGWGGAAWFSLLSIGYGFGDTDLRVDYVYQEEDEEANTRDFQQVLSVTLNWQGGPVGIRGDLSFGAGFADQGQSDVWGFVLMPFYDIGRHIQFVGRYTHLASEDDNGLRLNRYESTIVSGRGDRYNEFYAGCNLFFYGHKFKWQTGVSWADMADHARDGGEYEGWALLTGIRLYW